MENQTESGRAQAQSAGGVDNLYLNRDSRKRLSKAQGVRLTAEGGRLRRRRGEGGGRGVRIHYTLYYQLTSEKDAGPPPATPQVSTCDACALCATP